MDEPTGLPGVSTVIPTHNRPDLMLRAVRSDPRLRKYLRWSVMPEAYVRRGRCTVRVTIGDARYGSPSRLARETRLPTGAPGC